MHILAIMRDISILILALQGLIFLAVAIAAGYFLIRGMNALLRAIPKGFAQVRELLTAIQRIVSQASNIIIRPFIIAAGLRARIAGILRALSRPLRNDSRHNPGTL